MKKSKILLGLLFLVTTLCIFAACDTTTGKDGGHKVTFTLNYAGAPDNISAQMIADGKTATEPSTTPTRDGFVFRGWYLDNLGFKKYDFSTPVTSNLRLFAKWGLTIATVTFDYRDGSTPSATTSVDVGEKIKKPEDPMRDNYTFAGWFINAACTEKYDFNTEATDNLTLYAGWNQDAATVMFFYYDGRTETAMVDVGETVTKPTGIPIRDDYTFTGWFTDRNAHDEYDFSATVAGDLTLYAGWKLAKATITVNENYTDGETSTIKVNVGEPLVKPSDPTRNGYDFTDWYMDSGCTVMYDFTTLITENTTIYAGWSIRKFTVTFGENYENGGKAEVVVEWNNKVDSPENDPEREGFSFTGWYMDAACTTLFDFTQSITEDTAVYAGWKASTGGEIPADGYIVRFLLNDGTENVYDEQEFTQSNQRAEEPAVDPARKGYFFVGWFKDKAGKTEWSFRNDRVNGVVNLYAKWLKGYTFEAEYTNVDGKPGQGSSDNCIGTDIIQSTGNVSGNGTEMGMSNGHYVGKLYYNGAFLEFKVNSTAEVFDAVLVMRLTPDLYDMCFTDETWQVLVNGDRLYYGDLNLLGAIAYADYDSYGNDICGDDYKRHFDNYVISMSVHLLKGVNTIRLVTNNREDHGGTFNAHTPLIDCMYLYSSSTLSWAECHPENVNQTAADVKYDVTYESDRSMTTDREEPADA